MLTLASLGILALPAYSCGPHPRTHPFPLLGPTQQSVTVSVSPRCTVYVSVAYEAARKIQVVVALEFRSSSVTSLLCDIGWSLIVSSEKKKKDNYLPSVTVVHIK
jgi:hypothetical protein